MRRWGSGGRDGAASQDASRSRKRQARPRPPVQLGLPASRTVGEYTSGVLSPAASGI